MTQFPVAMDTALASVVVLPFGAIKIELPDHTILLLDSSGIAVADGDTYTGIDATYGTIYSVEPITDGVGSQAPALRLSFQPNSEAAAADLASADMQGAKVTMILGVAEETNGLVIDSDVIFKGQLNTAKLTGGRQARRVEMVITTGYERFFLTNDGARLSDTRHKSTYPEEEGMSFVTYITHQIYWGSDAPSGVTQ